MAESQIILDDSLLVDQAQLVGADYRFAGLSDPARTGSSVTELSVGVVPEDEDYLSLGSGGGDTSPIRQSDKDLLEGRSWCEEMEHFDGNQSSSNETVEDKLAKLDGG